VESAPVIFGLPGRKIKKPRLFAALRPALVVCLDILGTTSPGKFLSSISGSAFRTFPSLDLFEYSWTIASLFNSNWILLVHFSGEVSSAMLIGSPVCAGFSFAGY
jgi:hypothetical protein